MANLGNVNKWVTALRSGDYTQAKRVLNDTEGYCCLGVACETAIADGLPLEAVEKGFTAYFQPATGMHVQYGEAATFLPEDVKTWLGVKTVSPWVRYNGRWHTLTDLNDDGGFSFRDIANLIEETARDFPEWVGLPIRSATDEDMARRLDDDIKRATAARDEDEARKLVNA